MNQCEGSSFSVFLDRLCPLFFTFPSLNIAVVRLSTLFFRTSNKKTSEKRPGTFGCSEALSSSHGRYFCMKKTAFIPRSKPRGIQAVPCDVESFLVLSVPSCERLEPSAFANSLHLVKITLPEGLARRGPGGICFLSFFFGCGFWECQFLPFKKEAFFFFNFLESLFSLN